ncbi:MAG: hypothetical protein NW206_03745 [Hyphomonadaceae bacterium]|nr:hypothetical protein [Hyphomonadaceae bacterium]
MPYKVIIWGAGNVGRHALRAVITNPAFELAGVIVHGADKIGVDAGVLAGLAPCGVIATNDAAAVLAQSADVVCYTANADQRPFDAIQDLVRCMESGKHVVSSSLPFLTYPPQAPPFFTEALEAAAKKAGVGCFTSGIDPGFANDLIPLTLLTCCERVESVRIFEVLNYAHYDQAVTLFDIMGFGKPMDHIPTLLQPGILTLAWGGVVQMMADACGAKLDEIREHYVRLPAPYDFDIRLGPIAKGTAAALRFELQGIVGGRPAIIVEHVTRLHDDIAPEWPKGNHAYRIEIVGSPNMNVDLEITAEGSPVTGGLLGSAMRLLHAIPAVMAAPPGLISTRDLPLTPGQNIF